MIGEGEKLKHTLIKLGPVVAVNGRAIENYWGTVRACAGLVRAVLDKLVNGETGGSRGGLICNGLLEMAVKIAEGNLASVIAYRGKQDKFAIEVRRIGSYFSIVVSSESEERRKFWAVVAATRAILRKLGVKVVEEEGKNAVESL